jgi:hypothetical protein
LDIPSFMPEPQRYFGQFSQTLRSLALSYPKGSVWQIVFFIGLFPHLRNLEFHSDRWSRRKPAGDLTLIPPFVPPLRGRLTGRYSGGVGLAKTMIEQFGGVRFHRMDLRMSGTQPLLYACANTLERLQLYATDLYGENSLSKDV